MYREIGQESDDSRANDWLLAAHERERAVPSGPHLDRVKARPAEHLAETLGAAYETTMK